MSLYDEALAAGAPARPRLSPELIQQIINSPETYEVGSNGLQRYFTDEATGQRWYANLQNYAMEGEGDNSFANRSKLGAITSIGRDVPNPDGFKTAQWEQYDLDGNFTGTGAYDNSWREMIQAMAMVAPAVGGIVGWAGAAGGAGGAGASAASAGSGAANGAFLGENVASGIGGWDQAFVNAGGTLEGAAALSSGVTPQSPDVTTQLQDLAQTPTPTGSEGMQQIEVVGQKLGQAPLDVSAPIGGELTAADLAVPGATAGTGAATEMVDPSNYSNEGRNYPTTESTQGPGGSPVNASIDPSNINKPSVDVNGNPLPVNNGGGNNGGTNPFGSGDWGNLFNVLSGLYGLKLANDAADKSDPFGPYRKGYADKLQALEANPGLLQNTPGYLAGQDTIKRQMASKGYLGSGNMSAALMRYSGDAYQQEAGRLAQLAGAGIAPGNTHFNAANLTGQSLSNIGYGLAPYMQGGPR